MHIDDFEKHENSRFEYSLQNLQEHKQFNFYPAGEFDGHISGTTLNVNGVALDDDVSARVAGAPQGGGENNDPVPTTVEVLKEASPDALGPQRVAVIFLKQKGSTFTPYYTKEQTEEMIFRGDIQNFFKEASYGKTWIDEEKSKVFGWYEVKNIDADSKLSEDFMQQMIKLSDPDINFLDFDRIMVAVSMEWSAGWGTIGKDKHNTADGISALSFSVFGMASDNMLMIASHELGHNIGGVYHANFLHCFITTDTGEIRIVGSIGEHCNHVEYDDRYDVMGSSFPGPKHFNAYFKEIFRWIPLQSIIDVNQPGEYTFTLKPIEDQSVVVAKIGPSDSSRVHRFYLEYRKSKGFDTNMPSGLYVHWVSWPSTSYLLNMQPSHWPNFFMEEGSSFSDQSTGITISLLEQNHDREESKIKVIYPDNGCKLENLRPRLDKIYYYTYTHTITQQGELNCKVNDCEVKRDPNENVRFLFNLEFDNIKNSKSCSDLHIISKVENPDNILPTDTFSEWESLVEPEGLTASTVQLTIPAKIADGSYTILLSVRACLKTLDSVIPNE